MITRSGVHWAGCTGYISTRHEMGYTDLALCGTLAGAMLMLALSVWSILSGHFDASDPFVQVMAETIGAASAGVILPALLDLVHRLFLHRM